MRNKGSWIIILLTLILNVVLLQWTVEAYFGQEYERVYMYTGIAMVSVIVALITYFRWRKLEYK